MTINSNDEIHRIEKNQFNIRDKETPTALTGLRAKYFDLFNKCENKESYFMVKAMFQKELKNEIKGVRL